MSPSCGLCTRRLNLTALNALYFYLYLTLWQFESIYTPICKPGHPTFVIVQLIPVAIDNVHVQKAEESASDKEAVGQGKVFDVAHVQGVGVGGRGNCAQANQLADNIPDTNTWKNNKNGTQRQKKERTQTFFHKPNPQNTDVSKSKHLRLIQLMENGVIIEIRAVKQ